MRDRCLSAGEGVYILPGFGQRTFCPGRSSVEGAKHLSFPSGAVEHLRILLARRDRHHGAANSEARIKSPPGLSDILTPIDRASSAECSIAEGRIQCVRVIRRNSDIT